MIYDRKKNRIWDGPGFLLEGETKADKDGRFVVRIHDLNPDRLIQYRMSRSDMLKIAVWFFSNAWRSVP